MTLRDLLEVYPYAKTVAIKCRDADGLLIHYFTFSDEAPSGNGVYNDIRAGKHTYVVKAINHNGLKKANGFTEQAFGYKEKSIPDELIDMTITFMRVGFRWHGSATNVSVDLETNPLTVESVKDKLKSKAVSPDALR